MRKISFVLILALLLTLSGCTTTEQTSADVSSESLTLSSSHEESELSSAALESSAALDLDEEAESSSKAETSETSANEADILKETKEDAAQKAAGNTAAAAKQIASSTSSAAKSQSEVSKTDISSETESSAKTETSTAPVQTPAPTAEPADTQTKPPQAESTPAPIERPSAGKVASLVASYINQYRGSPATVLPGLGNVAFYRANQLMSNFAHSDGIAACNALQYGEYVDMTLYGMSESDSYYQGYNREAIAKGNWSGTAEEIAQKIAAGFKNSSSHWSYLGSGEYSYMAVGCAYNEANSTWYCCICVSAKNYGG